MTSLIRDTYGHPIQAFKLSDAVYAITSGNESEVYDVDRLLLLSITGDVNVAIVRDGQATPNTTFPFVAGMGPFVLSKGYRLRAVSGQGVIHVMEAG